MRMWSKLTYVADRRLCSPQLGSHRSECTMQPQLKQRASRREKKPGKPSKCSFLGELELDPQYFHLDLGTDFLKFLLTDNNLTCNRRGGPSSESQKPSYIGLAYPLIGVSQSGRISEASTDVYCVHLSLLVVHLPLVVLGWDHTCAPPSRHFGIR